MRKVVMKLTFKAVSFEKDGTNQAIEAGQCVELPEIAIIRTRQRFLWTERIIFRKDTTEYEMPTLLDAVIFALQQNGIPQELMDEELKKYIEQEGPAGRG